MANNQALTAQVGDIWYRYTNVTYASALDEYENIIPGSGRVAVNLAEFVVLRVTPKGVWVTPPYYGDPRFIRLSARKRYACPTKEEALTSFLARKERQLSILEAQARNVRKAIAEGEALKKRG